MEGALNVCWARWMLSAGPNLNKWSGAPCDLGAVTRDFGGSSRVFLILSLQLVVNCNINEN
jgi:hypothetical protein